MKLSRYGRVLRKADSHKAHPYPIRNTARHAKQMVGVEVVSHRGADRLWESLGEARRAEESFREP